MGVFAQKAAQQSQQGGGIFKQIAAQQPVPQEPQQSTARGVFSGMGKEGWNIARNVSQFGQKALDQTGGRIANLITGQGFTPTNTLAQTKASPNSPFGDRFGAYLEPKNGAERAGTYITKAASFLAPTGAVTKAQGAVTNAVNLIPAASRTAQFARGALGVAARAVPEAVSAGGVTLAQTGDIQEAKRNALLGGGISAGLGTFGALARGAKSLDATKSVLSATSGIPKSAMDTVAQKGIDKTATPEAALAKSRTAVKTLRSNMTQMWKDRVPQLVSEFKTTRMGLADNEVSKIAKIADEFGLDEEYIPQNLRSMSVKESLDLMKGLNGLDSKAVALSPKGAIVRQLRSDLRTKVLSTFGGEQGSVAKLWGEYSAKSGIHDSMDNIVRAYISNKPISDVTAKNRLMAIFDENKVEYINAVKAIEKELGVDITGQVASTKFQDILPQAVMKANGGLPTKAGVITKLVQMLALPLTSPRLVGKAVGKSTGEAGAVGKRIFGDYAPMSSAIENSSKSSASMSLSSANSSKSVSSIPGSKPQYNFPSSSIIPKSKKTSFLQEMSNKTRDEGQKGMIRNPLASQDPLIQEAKKYKSAEEFVKAQGKPLYHGSPYMNRINTEGFKLGRSENLANAWGRGVYFAENKRLAQGYSGLTDKGGGIVEAYIPKDLKLYKAKANDAYMLKNEELIKKGYGGVTAETGGGNTTITVFDPSVIKTRSQLTDIWNQANKPSYLNEMLNKAKTEGERGFVKLPFSGKTVKAIDALTKKELIDTAAYIRSNTYNKTKQDALDALAKKYEINTESGDKKLVLKQINALLNKTKTPETLPGTYTRKRI